MTEAYNSDPKRFIAWSLVLGFLALTLIIVNNNYSLNNLNTAALVSQANSHSIHEGELDVIKSDDFENPKNIRYDYFLRDVRGNGVPLNMRGISEEVLEKLRSGDKVKVTGNKNEKNELVATDLQVTSANSTSADSSTIDPAAAVSLEERRAVVMLVNFADKNVGATVAGTIGAMYTGTNNVDRWYRTSSIDQLGFAPDTDGNGTPDVFGPFTVSSLSTDTTCSYYQWATEAEAQAQAAGVDLTKYQHRVFIVPSGSGCGWSGIANLGCGTYCRAWSRTLNTFVLTHELGHNLSMHHASTDPENDGVVNSEYGDYSDPMGNGRTLFSGANFVRKGWSNPFPGSVLDVTSSGEFTISPLSGNPETSSSSQILRIPKATTGEYYYLSFRKAEGMDSAISAAFTAGVSIQRSRSTLGGRTYLIKTLSETSPVWSDPANGITVTQLERAIDGNYVRVAITVETVCHAANPTVTLTPTSQSSSVIEPMNFNVSVRNNDDAGCPAISTFTPSLSGSGVTGSFSTDKISVAPGQTTSLTLTATPAATDSSSFTVTVKDTDGVDPLHGDVSVQGSMFVDGTAPTVPTLSGSIDKQGAAALSWTTSKDNVGVTGYDVLRDGVLLLTVNGTSYTDKPALGTYSYTVRARDAAQNVSAVSNSVDLAITRVKGGGSTSDGGGGGGNGKKPNR